MTISKIFFVPLLVKGNICRRSRRISFSEGPKVVQNLEKNLLFKWNVLNAKMHAGGLKVVKTGQDWPAEFRHRHLSSAAAAPPRPPPTVSIPTPPPPPPPPTNTLATHVQVRRRS